MKKPTRLVDLNGEVINSPQGYHEVLNTLRGFVDSMEESQADRSDMQVVIADLFSEVRFYMKMLRRRQTKAIEQGFGVFMPERPDV